MAFVAISHSSLHLKCKPKRFDFQVVEGLLHDFARIIAKILLNRMGENTKHNNFYFSFCLKIGIKKSPCRHYTNKGEAGYY
jgi:hypothetical protein